MTLAVDRSIAHRQIPLLLSIFRSNPELSSLFFALFVSIRPELDAAQRHDVLRLADYFRAFPRERTVFRFLDHAHGVSKFYGLPWAKEASRRMARYGCLPTDGTVFNLDCDIFYAVTHTIFYVTDFGQMTADFTDREADAIALYLLAMADVAVEEGDVDILSEILLCLVFLGAQERVDDAHVNFIVSRQCGDGSWAGTGPVIESVRRDGIPESAAPFFSNYHTTLLARDVMARILAADHSAVEGARPNHRSNDSPLTDRAGIHPRDFPFPGITGVDDLYEDHRVGPLLTALRDVGPHHDRHPDRSIIRHMNNNDIVEVARLAARGVSCEIVRGSVRAFHDSNKSLTLGYGFPNPDGTNYQVDRRVLMAAGSILDAAVSQWDSRG